MKRYSLFIIAAAVLYCVCVISFQLFLYLNEQLPARDVSDSLSFNEKISWLAKRGPLDCKILASGSSLTQNDLSSKEIENAFGPSYLNVSSWGITPRQNYNVLNQIEPYCKPSVLIIVSGLTDFRLHKVNRDNFFNANEVKDVLEHRDYIPRYARLSSFKYYWDNYRNIREQRLSRKIYASLAFDEHGGTPYDARDWSHEQRWHKRIIVNWKIDLDAYEAVEAIADQCSRRGIRLVFVQAPVRPDGLKSELAKQIINRHVDRLRKMAKINKFTFIDFTSLLSNSSFFMDPDHLNRLGAERMTADLISKLSGIPTGQ